MANGKKYLYNLPGEINDGQWKNNQLRWNIKIGKEWGTFGSIPKSKKSPTKLRTIIKYTVNFDKIDHLFEGEIDNCWGYLHGMGLGTRRTIGTGKRFKE